MHEEGGGAARRQTKPVRNAVRSIVHHTLNSRSAEGCQPMMRSEVRRARRMIRQGLGRSRVHRRDRPRIRSGPSAKLRASKTVAPVLFGLTT